MKKIVTTVLLSSTLFATEPTKVEDIYLRNIELLTKTIEKEPNNARSYFSMGENYFKLKDYDEAIKWYKVRIEKGGSNKNELWRAACQLGECYESKKEWEPALFWFLKAYQIDNEKVDSLKRIAAYYRLQGDCNLTHLFASHGIRVAERLNSADIVNQFKASFRSLHFIRNLRKWLSGDK